MTNIDPEILYGSYPYFLDYVRGDPTARSFFECAEGDAHLVAPRRAEASTLRTPVAEALLSYNETLGASESTLAQIQSLRRSETLCVVGGQQAGFLGGPAYTAYKILSVIRLARHLADLLGVSVVPIFWLATEDHDLGEIRSIRFIDDDGALETVSIEVPQDAKAAEALPITDPMLAILARALERMAPAAQGAERLFKPMEGDDYATWHARIWSRLFARDGLILVEPRVLRPLSGPVFRAALERADALRAALVGAAAALERGGYPVPLDLSDVGLPFAFDARGGRTRILRPEDHVREADAHPERYSADVALRPILADSLLPTIANVLGPGEIAYHAMLRPLYDLFNLAQPLAIPRQGYTLVSATDASLLERLGLSFEAALHPKTNLRPYLQGLVSSKSAEAFDRARESTLAALSPLRKLVADLDPGMEARWRQTADRAAAEIDRLRDRAERAELARQGVSPRRVRGALAALRPAGKAQERVLSLVHVISRFGVEWLDTLPGADHPERFGHHIAVLQGEE